MPNKVSKLRIWKVDCVDKGAAVGARITLRKRHIEETQPATNVAQPATSVAKEGGMPTLSEVLASLGEEQRKVIEEAMQALKSAAPTTPEMKADGGEQKPDMSDEELEKQAPAVAKRLKEQKDAIAKREAEAEVLRKRLADMEDQALTRDVIAKAAALQRGAVGLDAGQLQGILKSVAKGQALTQDQGLALERHFAAVEEVQKQLYREVGTAHRPEGPTSSKVEALTKSLMASTPALSYAEAMSQVYENNPQLYAEMRAEEIAAARR